MARVDVKVVLLGSSGVGKTCLLDRFVNDNFEPMAKNTIGAAFAAKKVKVKSGNSIKLAVWDTAGAEQFESLSRMYYHGSQAAVCCFDASQKHSFEKLQFWVSELRDHEPQCSIWICQTKTDLLDSTGGAGAGRRREVTAKAAQRYADSMGAPLSSTSAKLGHGITELFQSVAEALAAKAAQTAHPRPPGLPAITAHPPLASPRSHSIVLSPDHSPPSSGTRHPATYTKPSTCC